MNPIILALLAVLLAVLCILLVFRFGKIFFKIFLVFSFMFILALVIIMAFIVDDSLKFKEKISTDSTLLLLEHNNSLAAGIVLRPSKSDKISRGDLYENAISNATTKLTGIKFKQTKSKDESKYSLLSLNSLNKIEDYYQNQMLENLSSYGKIFVIDINLFNELDKEFDIGIFNLTSDEIIMILKSENSTNYFFEFASQSKSISENILREQLVFYIEPESTIESVLFGTLLEELFNGNSLTNKIFISGLRTGDVKVYPNTILFKMIAIIPDNFIENIMKRVMIE